MTDPMFEPLTEMDIPSKGGGCNTPPINSATAQHLTLEEYADAKKLPVEFLKTLGLTDMNYLGSKAVRIPYFDIYGKLAAARIRIALTANDRFRWTKGAKTCLYGLNRLPDTHNFVVLVEGESDCHTLWSYNIPAVGLPGAGNWNDARDAEHLDPFETIYVIREPDQGGDTVEGWIAKSSIRERVKLVSLGEYKDPSELHISDPDHFHNLWLQALDDATTWDNEESRNRAALRNEAWRQCEKLARESDILDTFIRQYRRIVVGEDRAAKLLYLALTSRLLKKPVSVAVKGPSSGGKSYITETVLRFFPDSAYHALTAMSERALAYGDEPLSHRFLVIYEATGMEGDMQSYLIRSLLSEGKLRYEFVEKTKDGLQNRLIEREGPTGLIVTTTRFSLHPENETRLLSLSVTDTPDQTRAIFGMLADEDIDEPDLEPWQSLQHWLATGDAKVTIPFASVLAELVPPAAVRLRRDFGALLNLIRAHALLHQANRKKDGKDRIVATHTDYAVVRELVSDLVAEGVEATVPATVRETVNVVSGLLSNGKNEVSQVDLVNHMKLDKGPVSRRVRQAISRGFLRNNEDRKGKTARLILGGPMPDDLVILPTVETVLQCCAANEGGKPPPSPACWYCGEKILSDQDTVPHSRGEYHAHCYGDSVEGASAQTGEVWEH